GRSSARRPGRVSGRRRLAIAGPLTGVHTRRFLDASLPVELTRARRTGAAPALFILDVDHFKSINDGYGHPAGDRALVEIACRLSSASRAGDLLARHGGAAVAGVGANAPPR